MVISFLPPATSNGTLATTSPIMICVIGQNAISAMTPATARPLYRAGMTFFSPGFAFTNQVPTMEAMMAKPPIARG
jgi:hypothetical protein